MAKKQAAPQTRTNPRGGTAEANGASKQAQWDKFSRQADKTWKKAREAKGGSFEQPEIEDGKYRARIIRAVADFSKGSKGKEPQPYFRLQLVVLEGDYVGTKLSRTDWLTGRDDEETERNQEYFSKTLDGAGYDVSKLAMSELPGLAGEISKDKPFVEISTQTKVSASNGKKYLTIFINRELTEEEIGELENTGDDSGGNDEEGDKTPPRSSKARR